ncbi:hypothetical protein Acr_08g0010540 [Actinidia rufa]|uniref:Uncharacterized protein n=1 Tax=Actinidia rufa TaxID=165716 RepID=A0A7J0F1T6_9ERIC|nr:hypothetical protein Acr_08g0010540 [Actinidia rufa]
MMRSRTKHAVNDLRGDGSGPSNPPPLIFKPCLFKNEKIQATWLPDFKERAIITGRNINDYFGFLQSRWEELAQYEPLSDFPAATATIAFAIIDGDERRRRLIQASPAISPGSTPIADQMTFATSGSGPHPSGSKPTCSYCGNIGHIGERCCKLHPELKGTFFKRKGNGPPRTATVAETSPGHVLDLSHIQSQLGLLQSQLGSLLQQQPLGSTAILAIGTPTAFHAKTDHPTWVLDSVANDHMTGKLSIFSSHVLPIKDRISKKIFGVGYERDGLYYFGDPPCENVMTSSLQASILPNSKSCLLRGMNVPKYFWHMAILTATFLLNRTPSRSLQGTPSLPGPDAEPMPIDLDELPRPIPLFDSPSVQVPPASAAWAPLKVYTRRTSPSTPLPLCHSLLRYLVASISIPCSVSEALQNPQWVAAMQEEMDALERNSTWGLVTLPSGAKPISSKWVFNVKFQADGSIE